MKDAPQETRPGSPKWLEPSGRFLPAEDLALLDFLRAVRERHQQEEQLASLARQAEAGMAALSRWKDAAQTDLATLPSLPSLPGKQALEAALAGVRQARQKERAAWVKLGDWQKVLAALAPRAS
jgi:hypothetical protein